MDIHQELKELSKFLSEYSTSLMAVGVQTSRIVRNTSRIAESFGFFCDMTIFQKTIIMTLRDADNSHSYSTVNKIKPMGLNFAINSALRVGKHMTNICLSASSNVAITKLSANHVKVNGLY